MTDNAISNKHISPFERIRCTNDAGNEYWSSREFAQALGYSDYRNFELVINKSRTACFNSGQRIDDHSVDITEMIAIGKGRSREYKHLPSRTLKALHITIHQSLQNPRIHFPFPRWCRLINRGPFIKERFSAFQGN